MFYSLFYIYFISKWIIYLPMHFTLKTDHRNHSMLLVFLCVLSFICLYFCIEWLYWSAPSTITKHYRLCGAKHRSLYSFSLEATSCRSCQLNQYLVRPHCWLEDGQPLTVCSQGLSSSACVCRERELWCLLLGLYSWEIRVLFSLNCIYFLF